MLEEVLLGLKVDVVGGVDGLGDAVDLMGGGETTAELGVVLDVVDAGEGMSREEEGGGGEGGGTYSSEALCIMLTVSAMMLLDTSSTWNQWLRAFNSCRRIPLPGMEAT